MATTYTLIASNTLSSSAASVTFSSIPNSFTDLALKLDARSNYSSSTVGSVFMTFNGTISGYGIKTLENQFGSIVSVSQSAQVAIPLYNIMPYLSFGSNIFGTGEIYIPGYTLTQTKPCGIHAVVEQNSNSGVVEAIAGLATNTSAITSIKFEPDLGSFVSGSSFFLYGIKNS